MSFKNIIQITCPECNKEFDFEKWDSINVDINPEMKSKVIDLSLYKGKCPHCEKENNFIYPLLYHDMTHQVMIYSCDEDEVNKIKKDIRGLKKTSSAFPIEERYRIVTNAFLLSEKARIFDAGYDDRVIEILKVVIKSTIYSEHPEIKNPEVIFAEVDKKEKKLGFLIFNDKNELEFSILHEDVMDKYDAFKFVLLEDNCSIIDESWATTIYNTLVRPSANKEKKEAYLFRCFPKKTIYNSSGAERKLQRKERVVITIETGEEDSMAEGDLALVFFNMDLCGALSSIGRILGPVRKVQKVDDPTEIMVVDILVDFYFDIYILPPYDKQYLNYYITDLDFMNGAVCEKMKLTDVEPFIKDFVCRYIASNNPTDRMSFCKKIDHRQLMTTYIDDFCPELRKAIFDKNGIEADGMKLIYDEEKVKEHPKLTIEYYRLESLFVPTRATEPKQSSSAIPVIEDEPLIVNGNDLVIPGRYEAMLHTPGETSDTTVFIKNTQNSMNTIKIKPIKKSELQFMDDPEKIIRDIRLWLHNEKKQGLIEVNIGKTSEGIPFSYYIIKIMQEPSGVMYYLNLHFGFNKPVSVTGHFEEKGITGERDSIVFALLRKEGTVKVDEKNIKDWTRDPYDSREKKGALMNLSEEAKYDVLFPMHPLSECRKFINFIIENN